MPIPTLCDLCRHHQQVVSGKGSRFLLCRKSKEEKRYPKYPPQPVIQCEGFEKVDETNGSTD